MHYAKDKSIKFFFMNILRFMIGIILFLASLPSFSFGKEYGMKKINKFLNPSENTHLLNVIERQSPDQSVDTESNEIAEDAKKEDRLNWLLWGLLPVTIALAYIAYRNYKLKRNI